jgi:hypothetical protein
MSKQTAIEWLEEQLKKGVDLSPLDKKIAMWITLKTKLFNQAKAMEKEQVINSRLSVFEDLNKMPYGMEYLGNLRDALEDSEKYYKETYKGGE